MNLINKKKNKLCNKDIPDEFYYVPDDFYNSTEKMSKHFL